MSDSINREDFPSNSESKRVVYTPKIRELNSSEPISEKKVKKTIKGRAIRQKRSAIENVGKTFFGEDTRNVASYILYDVLIPAAKNTIQEMISSGIEMLLFGETRSNSRGRSDKGRSIVSYSSFYKRGDDREETRHRRPIGGRDRFNLDEIIFRSGSEAAEVLDGMCDLLEQYDQVTVGDYFDMAGVEGATWVHQKWGWENLSKAYCSPVRGGYMIVLPKAIELE